MHARFDIPLAAPVLLILSLPLLLTMHPLAWAVVGLLFLFNLFGILVTLFRLLFVSIEIDQTTPPPARRQSGIARLTQAERDIKNGIFLE